MKYIKIFKDNGQEQEVSYNEALETVLAYYDDNNETRAMLTMENYIPGKFSDIKVVSEP